MNDKRALIEHIRQINRSARYEWLDMFDPASLRQYLDHLQRALSPRCGRTGWVRSDTTAAVVTRRPEY